MLRCPRRRWLFVGAIFEVCASWIVPSSSFAAPARPQNVQQTQRTDEIQDISADIVARYTEVLAWFTGVLAAVSVITSLLIFSQARLQRQEFIATHRPRLRVRAMQTDGLGGATFVTVVNVGDGNARITGISGMFNLNRNGVWLGGQPDIEPRNPPSPQERFFEPGRRRTFLMPMPNQDPNAILEINAGREVMCAVGAIKYADDVGVERWTGFCWSYDPASQEFVNPEKETNLNYED